MEVSCIQFLDITSEIREHEENLGKRYGANVTALKLKLSEPPPLFPDYTM